MTTNRSIPTVIATQQEQNLDDIIMTSSLIYKINTIGFDGRQQALQNDFAQRAGVTDSTITRNTVQFTWRE